MVVRAFWVLRYELMSWFADGFIRKPLMCYVTGLSRVNCAAAEPLPGI